MRLTATLGLSLLAVLAAGGLAAQTSSAAVTLGSTLGVEPTIEDQCTRAESGRGCIAVNDLIPGRQVVAQGIGLVLKRRLQ